MKYDLVYLVSTILNEELTSDIEAADLEEITAKVVKDLQAIVENRPDIDEAALKIEGVKSLQKYFTFPTPIVDKDKDVIDSVIDLAVEEVIKIRNKTYDLNDEQKKKLINAYRDFDEQFWQVKLLKHQAEIIQALMVVLKDIHKVESDEFMKAKALSEAETPKRKAELVKAQTDAKTLYDTLLSTSKDLLSLKTAAGEGLVSVEKLKSKFKDRMIRVQDSISILYNDLYSLYSHEEAPSPPEQEFNRKNARIFSPSKSDSEDASVPSAEQQWSGWSRMEEAVSPDLSYKQKTDAMKVVHANIKKKLAPIVSHLVSDESTTIAFQKMSKAVVSTIEELNKVLKFFPSIQYSGDLFSSYRNSVRELDFVFTNLANLPIAAKSETVKAMLLKLQDFSSKIEKLFEVPTKISKVELDAESPDTIDPKVEPEAEKTEPESEPTTSEPESPEPESPEKTTWTISKDLQNELFSLWGSSHYKTGDAPSVAEFKKDLEEFLNFYGPFSKDKKITERRKRKPRRKPQPYDAIVKMTGKLHKDKIPAAWKALKPAQKVRIKRIITALNAPAVATDRQGLWTKMDTQIKPAEDSIEPPASTLESLQNKLGPIVRSIMRRSNG